MRRLLIPEVIQSSAMDCGPASLKALLEGFGVAISYGRLREACQTDVDGTSVDNLEETAQKLGLDAAQVMAPPDHFVLPESKLLPGLTVVRLPSGVTHFVIAWSRHGRWIQVMDPAAGRRWVRWDRLLDDLYIHVQPVPAGAWRKWAGQPSFQNALRRRMTLVGLQSAGIDVLLRAAVEDATWQRIAALDAAVRMVDGLIRSGGLRRGRANLGIVERLAAQPADIPERYWSVRPDPQSAKRLRMRGAVMIHVDGVKVDRQAAPLSAELSAALAEPPARPFRELLRAMRADGIAGPLALALALAAAAGGVVVEALLFRGLLDLAPHLTLNAQRVAALAAFFVFLAGLLLLEWPAQAGFFRLGQRLESRLRLRFLEKIPLLGDRYFQSRLISDMAQRCHSVHQLRIFPDIGGRLLRAAFTLAFTVAGLTWLYPQSALLTLFAALCAAGIPLAAQPLLVERDLRLREQTGSLNRFYLDALLGLTAVRAHGGERALRRVQEWQLADWADAGLRFHHAVVRVEAIQLTLSFALVAALVLSGITRGGQPGTILLMAYWAMSIPALGQEIAAAAWLYPSLRNVTLRFLEPLGASQEEQPDDAAAAPAAAQGVAIDIQKVTVIAAGHSILNGIDLKIEPGSHVGVVGLSGAGKSSLVGLLLGQHRPAAGTVLIDGEPLDAARLDYLRNVTAWIDPQVRLWNRSLLDNLLYGAGPDAAGEIEDAIRNAQLSSVLKRLPNGLQTLLGDGGAMVSGGEGQRVRMGRAFTRKDARLVILDEPARGLEFDRRRAFLARAREYWKDATLLCITHDVRETSDFDRVLVIGDGRVLEDGPPAELYADAGSRYRSLCDMERVVREQFWEGPVWKRLFLRDGKLEAESGKAKAAWRES